MTYFEKPVLGIESSCDETSVAIIDGANILANQVASQIEMHRKWGGVVPEAASRAHVEAILPMLTEALAQSGLRLHDLGAVAVTNQPGLVGALSVGVSAAKALSIALDIPLIGVHHLEGHLLSILSVEPDLSACLPMLSLVVSGGHTELVRLDGLGRATILAETLDDAAGEAFDKAARLLDLGYPGGAAISKLAESGDPKRYALPLGVRDDPAHFSFSGLKTAVLRLVQHEGERLDRAGLAASLQHAIIEALTRKLLFWLSESRVQTVALVGGVAANTALRARLSAQCAREGVRFLVPPPSLCTDNAAMIALAGSLRLAAGERSDPTELDVFPSAPLPGSPRDY